MDNRREEENKSESECSSEYETDDEKEVKQDEQPAEHKSRCCVDLLSGKTEEFKSPRKRKHSKKPQASFLQPCTVPILNFPKIQRLEITEKKITGKYPNCDKFSKELVGLDALNAVIIQDCFIEILIDDVTPTTYIFKKITFKNCNDNVYKVFRNLTASNGIIVHTDKFNGFPFKVTTLDVMMITFGWYVGLKPARTNFLHAQNESLKELTIHQLPYDFDGGEVLKYILEKMNLETFYYDKTPLILNGKKQRVKEFAASEIQITSAIEMLNQFPSVEKFILKICNTDISSEHIEKVLNTSGDAFKNLKEFVVIDSTRRIFGVFLGIFKNLQSLQKLTLTTNNKRIHAILESLPVMPKLEEFILYSTVANESQVHEAIKKHAPKIRIIKVEKSCTNEANKSFGGSSDINPGDMRNEPSCSNFQGSGGGDEPLESGSGGKEDDDGDGSKDNEIIEERKKLVIEQKLAKQ